LGREYSLTIRRTAPSYDEMTRLMRPLLMRAQSEMTAQGVRQSQLKNELWVDVRYHGQSFELKVPLTPDFLEDFHRAHERTFGYAAWDAAVEVVNLRLEVRAHEYEHRPERLKHSARSPEPIGRISAIAQGRRRAIPVFQRDRLGAGTRLRGPLLLVELSATAYVAPEFSLRIDDFGNVHLEARP
jgi:N-methylhydantoinase A